MIDFLLNDGGRAAAGYKGKTGDCLVRAIAIASGLEYRVVYKATALANKSAGYAATGNAYATGKKQKGQKKVAAVQDGVAAGFGFAKVKLPPGPKPTYTEAYAAYGDCLVTTSHHIAAVVDGKLQDTFDGRTYEWEGEIRERKAASVWVKTAPCEHQWLKQIKGKRQAQCAQCGVLRCQNYPAGGMLANRCHLEGRLRDDGLVLCDDCVRSPKIDTGHYGKINAATAGGK